MSKYLIVGKCFYLSKILVNLKVLTYEVLFIEHKKYGSLIYVMLLAEKKNTIQGKKTTKKQTVNNNC